jgi:hypothetical protein
VEFCDKIIDYIFQWPIPLATSLSPVTRKIGHTLSQTYLFFLTGWKGFFSFGWQ